jgi:hypothetical protein
VGIQNVLKSVADFEVFLEVFNNGVNAGKVFAGAGLTLEARLQDFGTLESDDFPGRSRQKYFTLKILFSPPPIGNHLESTEVADSDILSGLECLDDSI